MRRKHWGLVLAVIIAVTGCTPSGAADDEDHAVLANKAQYVASALEALVRLGDAPADADSAALVALVRAEKPEYVAPFDDRVRRLRQEGRLSSVLVCDAAGDKALVEDAGCTHETDARLWDRDVPCTFQLDLAAVCAR